MDLGAYIVAAPIVGVVALIFALVRSNNIGKLSEGNERMSEISGYIRQGAMAFLRREYRSLIVFIVVLFLVIGLLLKSWLTAICFLVGAIFSMLAGYIGMRAATQANVRTANAAKEGGMAEALKVAFAGGSVMGLTVVGLGILGIGLAYIIFREPEIITGFGLGASSIALFARVGGGIYRKAADVGADLVGKVEAGIPEDDPRNPAVIADNVGDNVGDVAGMGADLFESYVGAIISAITLGLVAFGEKGVEFALALAAVGVLSSIIGIYFVRGDKDPQKSLNMGTLSSSIITTVVALILSKAIFNSYRAFTSIVVGLAVGLIIAKITEYYTSDAYKPVEKIAKESETGDSTNIIAGLSVGMLSTAGPIVVIAIGIIIAYVASNGTAVPAEGLYGIALAAVGMLSTAGMTIAVDTYGPVADNAGGIAEMCELRKMSVKLRIHWTL